MAAAYVVDETKVIAPQTVFEYPAPGEDVRLPTVVPLVVEKAARSVFGERPRRG